MDHTYVDEKSLNSLEGYAVHLVMGMLSLRTLLNLQVKAIEIGILPEDMACRTNTIAWDLKRMLKLYQEQTESTLELLPDDVNVVEIIKMLQENEIKKAKSLTRKPRSKDAKIS